MDSLATGVILTGLNERDRDTSVVPGIVTQDGRKIPSVAIAEVLATPDMSQRKAAEILGCSRKAIKNWIKRANGGVDTNSLPTVIAPERPGFTIDGDSAVLVSPSSDERKRLFTKEELREEYGFPEDDWIETRAVISQYGSPDNPSGQIKMWLTKRVDIHQIIPARFPESYVAPKINRALTNKPIFGVVCGDSQVPHNDLCMEDCLLQLVAELQPDILIDLGDQGDNPTISSYLKNPKWNAELNECIQATTELNYYRRRACESMEMIVLASNHDTERVKNYVLSKAPDLYGVQRGMFHGEEDPEKVLTWGYLTKMDLLNIKLIGEDGDSYQHANHIISQGAPDVPGLAVEHGSVTGKSAMLKAVENTNYSMFFGHTHHAGMETKTVYDTDGEPHFIYSFNTGTMAKLKGSLGFAKRAQWVNTFCTYQLWPDGRFTVDFAKYENGELFWRDKRWKSNLY